MPLRQSSFGKVDGIFAFGAVHCGRELTHAPYHLFSSACDLTAK
jgi:hypothetical protein